MTARPTGSASNMGFDDYPRPALAVDPVLLEVSNSTLMVALRKRDVEPHKGKWGLPGVFVNLGETLEQAVARAAEAKCGVVAPSYVEQLFTWDMPGRDSRGWVVVVAYIVLVEPGTLERCSAGLPDMSVGEVAVDWEGEVGGPVSVNVNGRPTALAFDHDRILGAAVKRLRGRVRYTPLALQFLPPTFTLRELQTVYEAILGTDMNKDSFRRHVVQTMGFVEATGMLQEGVAHRPAELYRQVTTDPGS